MKTFQDYRRDVMRLYQEKKYLDALNAAIDASKRFPEDKPKTTFWIACLESRLGNLERAVHVLRESVQQGVWWPVETLLDSDLDPIRTRSEFSLILAECQRLKHESAKVAKPELLVKSPTGPSEAESWPVLVVCHQRYGERPDQTAHEWSSILRNGVGLAVPCSSQGYSPYGRCLANLDNEFRYMAWVHTELQKQPGSDCVRLCI